MLIDLERVGIERSALMITLKAQGVVTQVHNIPVHIQPFDRCPCGEIGFPAVTRNDDRTSCDHRKRLAWNDDIFEQPSRSRVFGDPIYSVPMA